ncbi:hypothetical protein BN971_01632 [Mycobacterium bohemicum DSM 44277]|uniref:Uncharacterized protein n=1 Tax=Mycobacterium bohemicum DSM 44277 TaxID=1236609 RepID=A0A0U0W6G8_MYCBE|nr:hypothetical protein BN971_01632 [Mycobacterium bohemicum DSM 44277]
MSAMEMTAMPTATRRRLGQSVACARDSMMMAVVARMMSAVTSPSVTGMEPASSRSCLSRTNTQQMTKSEAATIRPSSTRRRGVLREAREIRTSAAIAPNG